MTDRPTHLAEVKSEPVTGATSLIRFLAVGATASLLYAALVPAVIGLLNSPAFATSMVIFAFFVPATFHAHKKLSFAATKLRQGAFWGYAILQICCFSTISLVTSQNVTGLYWRDAMIYWLTVAAAALLSFIIGRLFIFRERK